MKRIDKKIFLLFVGRLAQAFFAILSIRLMTELLPKEQIGYQYLILTVVLWFGAVLVNPVGMYINRHLHEWQLKGLLYYYLKKVNVYFLLVALASAPVIFIVKKFTSLEAFSDFEVVVFFVLYIYISTWFQASASFFNLIDLQKEFVSLNIFSQVSGLIIATTLIHSAGASATNWLMGLVSGQGIALIFALIIFRRKFSGEKPVQGTEHEFLFGRQLYTFCVPIAVGTLCMWFSSQGYRLIVENKMGLEALASFGVGLGLAANLSSVVESITGQYLNPRYFSAFAKSNVEERRVAWTGLWKSTSIIYVSFFFFAITVSHLLVRVVASVNFRGVVPFVMAGAGVELMRQLSNVTYLAFQGEKKTYRAIPPFLLSALIIVVGFLILEKYYSLSSEGILAILIIAGIAGYMHSLYLVQNEIAAKVEIAVLARTAAIGLPAVIPAFLLNTESNIFLSFAACGISLLWAVGNIYLQLSARSQ